jgi:hypothetical protein
VASYTKHVNAGKITFRTILNMVPEGKQSLLSSRLSYSCGCCTNPLDLSTLLLSIFIHQHISSGLQQLKEWIPYCVSDYRCQNLGAASAYHLPIICCNALCYYRFQFWLELPTMRTKIFVLLISLFSRWVPVLGIVPDSYDDKSLMLYV